MSGKLSEPVGNDDRRFGEEHGWQPVRSLVWRLLDGTGWEHCSLIRVQPIEHAHGPFHRYHGAVVATEADKPILVHYVICLNKATGWLSCRTEAQIGAGEQQRLDLVRELDGSWKIGSPATRRPEPAPALAGAVEPDLEFSPVTNTLAIERLGLEIGASAELVTAWVRFPALTVEPYPQRYTRLTKSTDRFESEGFSAEIEVDDLNLVVRYGDLWERVAVSDGTPET